MNLNMMLYSISDIQGRHLTSQPTKGLYIRNGRKVVVR